MKTHPEGPGGGSPGTAPPNGVAVFLDLNGTLVTPILVERPEELQPIPGAAEAVARLHDLGLVCVVVTVQSRIQKGLFTEERFRSWFRGFARDMAGGEAKLRGPYVCPHRYAEPCTCEKPRPYLYERAGVELALRLEGSFVIGDSAADMQAARAIKGIGCLVRTGWAAEDAELRRARPFASFVGADLAEIVDWIAEWRTDPPPPAGAGVTPGSNRVHRAP